MQYCNACLVPAVHVFHSPPGIEDVDDRHKVPHNPLSQRQRARMSRFLSLAEAVEDVLRDGDSVAIEGFTHLIPFAAGHEVIRQRRKRLTLIRMTPDLIYDQLVGMGCADKLVFSWTGNPGVGSLHRVRDAVENGWPAPLAQGSPAAPAS